MTIRAAILGGAAASVLAATAALAQTDEGAVRYGNGPQDSTPAEQAQTTRLNESAAGGTSQSPAVLNGEIQAQPGVGSGPGSEAYGPPQDLNGGPPPNGGREFAPRQVPAANDQYQDQMRQYQAQMQQYRDDQQRFHDAHGAYLQNLRDYDRAEYDWYYPVPLAYHYGSGYGLQRLYLLAEPGAQLAHAPVEGPGGAWVGRVRNIEIAPDGRPSRVEVSLNRRVSVWVSPSNLRFDPDARVLYTDLTRDQLWDLPGATVESAPM